MMMIIIYGNIFWCCPLLFEQKYGEFFFCSTRDSRLSLSLLSLLFLPTCGTYIVNFCFFLFCLENLELNAGSIAPEFIFFKLNKERKKENPYNCLILRMFWLLLLLVHNYVDNIFYNNNYKTDIKKKKYVFFDELLSLSLGRNIIR